MKDGATSPFSGVQLVPGRVGINRPGQPVISTKLIGPGMGGAAFNLIFFGLTDWADGLITNGIVSGDVTTYAKLEQYGALSLPLRQWTDSFNGRPYISGQEQLGLSMTKLNEDGSYDIAVFKTLVARPALGVGMRMEGWNLVFTGTDLYDKAQGWVNIKFDPWTYVPF